MARRRVDSKANRSKQPIDRKGRSGDRSSSGGKIKEEKHGRSPVLAGVPRGTLSKEYARALSMAITAQDGVVKAFHAAMPFPCSWVPVLTESAGLLGLLRQSLKGAAYRFRWNNTNSNDAAVSRTLEWVPCGKPIGAAQILKEHRAVWKDAVERNLPSGIIGKIETAGRAVAALVKVS